MKPPISPDDAADAIIQIGRRMYERRYVASNDGNISVRLSTDRILVTPTGVSKGFMSRGDLVVVNMKGEKLSGKREATSEIKMHLKAFALRPDVRAVAHAHPPYATAFAVAGIPLAECVLPEVILTLGSIPIAPYATPSTDEMAEAIAGVVMISDAFLLRNHGVMTVGGDALSAYHKLETVEHFAEISYIARRLGNLVPLGHQEVAKLVELRASLGVQGAYPGCREAGACLPASEPERADLIRVIVDEVVKVLKEGKHAME
jgi:L-fuculose-phosphate aldolase